MLANEEVTSDGRSERGNFPVFRKPLAQWNMRITAYADRLLRDLELIDWPDKVRAMQRNWIGRSSGAHVRFPSPAGDLEVFTTRPDTLFGATYMVLAPEHPLVDALTPSAWPGGTAPAWTGGHADPREAVAAYRARVVGQLRPRPPGRRGSGEDRRLHRRYATNPVNGAALPVFVADYVLMGYGTGAIMAVPGQDERDWEFAEVFGLPIVRTVRAAGGMAGEGLHRRRPRDQQRVPRRPRGRRGEGCDHRVAGGAPRRAWCDDVPPARLAVQPSALLG